MSEELQKTIDKLNAENASLKKQLEQNAQGFEGLMSQLDATREQLNESMNSCLMLRTHFIQIKKHNAKVTNELEQAKNKIATYESNKAAEVPLSKGK